MKPLSLDEIRRDVHGRWLSRPGEVTIGNVCIDSRTIQSGDLFIAIEGERFDGHGFLAQAAEGGAAAAVIRRDREPPPHVAKLFDGGIIGVADTIAALGELGAHHRGLCGATVVAVSGSNGKTTVKQMIHHILSGRLAGSCSPKSFNNEIGVPLTLLAASGGDDYVVCEVGSNAPGEIAALAEMVRPNVAVITSVGPSHLEAFGDIQHVAAEKASLVGPLAQDGLAVVTADSDDLDRALRVYGRRTIRFGLSPAAELRLTGYEPRGRAGRFQLNGRFWADLPLAGRHNALNALAAIAVAQRFGFGPDEAAGALADFSAAEMRLQWIDVGGVTLINDAYNANPASVMAAVDVLAASEGARKVAVLGDMLELGHGERALHGQLGRDIAGRDIDLLIAVGPLGRYIAKAAAGEMETKTFDCVAADGREIAAMLRTGDTVLIKGSRAMQMERLIEPIRSALDGDAGDEKAGT